MTLPSASQKGSANHTSRPPFREVYGGDHSGLNMVAVRLRSPAFVKVTMFHVGPADDKSHTQNTCLMKSVSSYSI